MPFFRSICAFAWVLGVAGCGQTEQNGGESTPRAVGGAGGGAPSVPAKPTGCEKPQPGPAPLSHLSSFELNRSVEDLLSTAPGLAKPERLPDGPWDEELTLPVGSAFVASVHALAHEVALNLSRDDAAIAAVSDCDRATRGEKECRGQFMDKFLRRAYRRAVTQEDLTEMAEVFATGQKQGGGYASGIRAVVEVALQSPDFVYLIQQGNGDASGGAVALTGSETAARLAYFLTGTAPDAELSEAAETGALDGAAVEKQARRLLGSTRSRETLRRFYAQLLGYGVEAPGRDLRYTSEIAALAQEESGRFVEDVTFDGAGTFRALLTEPTTWVNDELAQFYGYPKVRGAAFQKVGLDPQQRRGLLTQAAFLSGTSFGTQTSPARRATAIMGALLCNEPPPPPPGTASKVDPARAGTTRTLLEASTSASECQSCHRDMNPLGFAFEHYDAAGLWRDSERDQPIDSSGELLSTDAQGPFRDALELLGRIAESDDAKACLVGHWLTQAYRRAAGPEDACARGEVERAFAASDGNLVELMVALTKTDSFRYRRESELAP